MKANLFPLQNHGMSRDLSISKAENVFAWENYNVRIVAREDDTLLSITNERGPKAATLSNTISGVVVGWNTLNDILVVFTHYDYTNADYIYRITLDPNNENTLTVATVYDGGNLGLSTLHPIESVMSYESEGVKKVYWVDGVNVLRSCNVMAQYTPRANNDYDNQFDSTKGVVSRMTIRTRRDNGGSARPNGVMQYFVTAFNELGVETGIICSSSLVYLSPMGRGGAADETNNNRIYITIRTESPIDFESYRVYGVLRTSYNGQEVTYVVDEVPIPTTAPAEVTAIDSGAHLRVVESSVLSFLGSSDVVASTIAQKDNTLFLGNLTINNSAYGDLEDWADSCRDDTTGLALSTVLSFDIDGERFLIPDSTGTYPYLSLLDYQSNQFKAFKAHEKYRFAVVFRKENGERSKAFWIGDGICGGYPAIDTDVSGNPVMFYYCPMVRISAEACGYAKESGYKYAQLFMAQATYADRSIKAQGFLNPTVFNLYDRYKNQPYARPSWNVRPMLGNVSFSHWQCLANSKDYNSELQSNSWEVLKPSALYWKGNDDVIVGNVPEAWLSNSTIPKGLDDYKYACVEMQWGCTSAAGTKFYAYVIIWATEVEIDAASAQQDDYGFYGCPQLDVDGNAIYWKNIYQISIPTFGNYPKPNWNDFKDRLVAELYNCQELRYLDYSFTDNQLEDMKQICIDRYSYNLTSRVCDVRLYEIGNQTQQLNQAFSFCEYSRHCYFTDTNIVTFHSPEIEYEQVNLDRSTGLKLRVVGAAPITASITDYNILVGSQETIDSKVIGSDYSTRHPSLSGVGTITASPLYYDAVVREAGEDTPYVDNSKAYYMMYAFHKIGSIINYTDANGTSKSTLENKRFANLQYSYFTKYVTDLDDSAEFPSMSDIRQVTGYTKGLYDLNTIGGTKLYGVNIESTVVMPLGFKYPIYRSDSPISKYGDNLYVNSTTSSSSPIPLTYNSRPHIVISLPSSVENSSLSSLYTLPRRVGSNGDDVVTLYDVQRDDRNILVINNTYKESIAYDLAITSDIAEALETYGGLIIDSTQYSVESSKMVVINTQGEVIQEVDLIVTNDRIITLPSGTSQALGTIHIVFKTNSSSIGVVYFYRQRQDSALAPVNIIGSSSSEQRYLGWTDDIICDTSTVSYLHQDSVDVGSGGIGSDTPYLWIAELYDDITPGPNDTRYGGINKSDANACTYIPCSVETPLPETNTYLTLKGIEGDTYIQRYDCMLSYPQSENDVNQIIDIASVMLETHVNLDGRTDKDRGVSKLASIDYTQFGSRNTVYDQENNYFSAVAYDERFNETLFPSTITWTKEKHPLETNDTWTKITLASTMSLDASYGPLNALRNYDNAIIAFQDRAISEVLFNSRVQLSTSDGVPVELANSGKVEGKRMISTKYGCRNKWSIVEGKSALYFKDDLVKVIAAFNGKAIDPISSKAKLDAWVRNHSSMSVWTPANFENTVSFYDNVHSDVYFIGSPATSQGSGSGSSSEIDNPPCLVYNEQLGSFVGFFSYDNISVLTNLKNRFLAYRHSAATDFWFMNEGYYNRFFGVPQDSYITWRVMPEPYGDKIWTNVEYRADFMKVLDYADGSDLYPYEASGYIANAYLPDETLTLKVSNEYQDTGYVQPYSPTLAEDSNNPDIRKKFRIWRADIPRDIKDPLGLDRIRNPWIWLTMKKSFDADTDINRMELHDVVVKYFTND